MILNNQDYLLEIDIATMGVKNYILEKINDLRFKLKHSITIIKIGSYSTTIYNNELGFLSRNESSIIAFQKKEHTREIYAFGMDVNKIIGKNPKEIEIEKLIENSKINNSATMEDFIKHYTGNFISKKINKQTAIIPVNSNISDNEESIIKDVVEKCGFFYVKTIEENVAALIGCGVDIKKPNGFIILDLGYSKSEISIVSIGFTIERKKIEVSGKNIDKDIKDYIFYKYNIILTDDNYSELKKILLAISFKGHKQGRATVYGKDINSGKIVSIEIDSKDILAATSRSFLSMLKEIRDFLNSTRSEFVSDVKKSGIILCGGLANIYNIDVLISKSINIPVFIINKPEEASVRGMAVVANNMNFFYDILK